MISHLSLIVFSLVGLTMTIVVHSIPLKSMQEMSPSSVGKARNPSSVVRTSAEKKKRNIDDYDELDDQSDEDETKDELVFNNKNKHVLHAQVKETQAQNHSIADELIDTDNSQLFTDVKMFPNELMQLASRRRRRRRHVTLEDKFPQRRKRALSTLNFYETDPFNQPYMTDDVYIRPNRDLGPVFWYPLLFRRIDQRSTPDEIDEDYINPWLNEEFSEPEERFPTSLEHWSVFDDDDFPINYHNDDDSYMEPNEVYFK